jgi:hypothetical protein
MRAVHERHDADKRCHRICSLRDGRLDIRHRRRDREHRRGGVRSGALTRKLHGVALISRRHTVPL